MRILVIEDKVMHQESARQTLTGHEVTIVPSFDDAMNLMRQKIDEKNVQRLLAEAGFPSMPPSPHQSKDEGAQERWNTYWATKATAEAQSVIPFPFEVVLTDMMMPMSPETLAPGVFNSREQVPYGFIIALKATLCGTKFVAMVTDTNHHKGAMSAAIDFLGDAYYHEGFKPNFVVNGAKVMFVHTPFFHEVLGKKTCEQCDGSGSCKFCRGTGQRNDQYVQGECNGCRDDVGKCSSCKGTSQVDDVRSDRKDWGQVLADLTAN